MLEAHEYLHLAIHASQENNHHAALDYLDRALSLEPDHPGARYYQAIEFAELGLFPRAASCMAAVVELEPGMDLARFQLGLLYLQLQQPEQARTVFESLQAVATDESLNAFASAYLSLLDEDHSSAISEFERGLTLCENQPLKGDMVRVLATLKPESSLGDPEPVAAEINAPVFLGAYRETLER